MSHIFNSQKTTLLPPPGLRGPHVQSILGGWSMRGQVIRWLTRDFVKTSSAQIVSCDNNVRLLAKINIPTESPRSVVVVLHGWEGGAESTYMLSVGNTLFNSASIVVRLNFRDHGGTQALNEELFHSCRIDEIVSAVKQIGIMYPDLPLHIVGFSLGGNFALRVAARAKDQDIKLRRVVAVCPVLSPRHTMAALESGLWIYRQYFLQRWRRSLLRKAELFPDLYQFGDLRRFSTLTGTTEFFVENYTDIASLNDYLDGYAITGNALNTIEVDSLLIATRDDPVIPVADLKEISDNPALKIKLLDHGGHCGLLKDYRLRSWLDGSIAQLLLD